MKKLVIAVLCICINSVVFAHGDHDKGASQMGIPIEIKQAKEFSRYVLIKFVQEGRLHKSWSEAQFVDAKTQLINAVKEWVVTFHNPKETDVSKKTIYVYLDEYGNPFSVNFTGQ